MKWFVPLLAGASLRDRVAASLGALAGIGVVGLAGTMFFSFPSLWIVAPIAASAVLLFAVPASPLAQPWSIVGGNIVSALTGMAMLHLVPDQVLAAALAVSGAILAMSLARCLHPPGGAVALSAVIGARSFVSADGPGFLALVALDSVLLVGTGWLFHRVSGHSYPHRPRPVEGKPPVPAPFGVQMADIDAALEDLGETFDIGREDLALLLERAEVHAAARVGKG
ncbi:hypothetical protein BWQ93_04265 [Sphingopyxis sp. QXT-31]|nr:HPP family protein [Sphingopyxis sp. QXT-31]APZ97788.1 hypothetical protein BWQ93_04265 [Sphingopyxis sp. QXT-31]